MTGCSGELYVVFLWISNPIFYGFIFPDYFLNIFSYLYIPLCLRKSFKFMVLRLLENAFVSQKIESVNFHSCVQAKLPLMKVLIITTPGRSKLLISSEQHISKICFSPAEKGKAYGAEKMSKINFARELVTCFNEFHHICHLNIFGFCFVVPYKLDSSMLKCEGSLP